MQRDMETWYPKPTCTTAAPHPTTAPPRAHLWVLGEGDVGPQVEVQAVVRLVCLQQLNNLLRGQLLGVLLGNIDHNLCVHVDGRGQAGSVGVMRGRQGGRASCFLADCDGFHLARDVCLPGVGAFTAAMLQAPSQ
jgi:hypothetical protein